MIKRKAWACLLLLVAVISCRKSFEDRPLNFVSEQYIWDETDVTGNFAQQWVHKIYSQLPTGWSRINGLPLECASDDAVPSNPGNATWNMINSGYDPLNTFDNNWGSAYSAIRRVNIFLKNYRRVPWIDSLLPKWLGAEVRVMRAYFYYDLMKRYGGIPLLDNQVFEADDPALFSQRRSSFESCVQYVVNELDAVRDSLRPDETLANRGSGNGNGEGSDGGAGRIRKSIALAIKAKVLLLAASPLFNPSSTPALDYTGYAEGNTERWKAAADAAREVMDLNLFALENNRYLLNYTRVNKEFIFTRYGASYQSEWGYRMSPVGYNSINNRACEGQVSPTQELVDAFPMKNGLPITDPTSGYDPAKPYNNRDPRLDQTVFYDGATWLKRKVEIFEGGRDKPNSAAVANGIQTQTGYYLKKGLANDASNAGFTTVMFHPSVTSTFCLIRYADILLMYAEAQNEYGGPDASVYSAVEAVRKRAGLSPFTLPAGLSKDAMREVIRNERRVEFAFEEQRYFDIRRWKIAKQVYGVPLHGVSIIKNTDGSLSYSRKTVASPYFNEASMYLYPVDNKEILVNSSMQQNPNY
ncbi:RagB/SusD family nutrient uptake outer membrane protein [Chitinophaga tropicalis]|uniref:RagB/SusD family nutrient uptake outer membrane protein n=1 Tax=Chitinophaga tropicalis TaxID=2683588 RepID=A0A7K1U364_9BACT|nr:RagB/SusD family nutrient uptake outer membrane protein [Chitinophaga tropicalis]MVT08791.1 RagB/SusD family nutrient uptake outer membrane protein [Chitinophaga tropicalis]